MPVDPLERLDRRLGLFRALTLEPGRDDVAVVRILLAADDYPVSVGDGGVDHGVAANLEDEVLTLTDQLLGQRERVLDHLLGQDRATSGDMTDPGHVGRLLGRNVERGNSRLRLAPCRALLGCGGVRGERIGRQQLHRPRAPPVAVQVPLLLQGLEVVRDAGRAPQAHRVPDLADRRRIAAPGHPRADNIEHLLFTG